VKPNGLVVSSKVLRDLYTRMLLIRHVEEKIAVLYPEQEMRCPTHLSIGHEAVAAGVCAALHANDVVFLNHRCHAGYIAKGGDIPQMMAELYGKKTGCAQGRGGSMHLVDPDAGVLGTSAIVAGTIPIACGAAFSFSRQRGNRVAVSFFGDAAIEEGTFFESINMACLWKLPVLFICENNGYSTCTPLSKRQVSTPIFKRIKPFVLPSTRIDGNDVLLAYKTAARAIEHARNGRGPSFIECVTYRWREHVGPDFDWNLGYRSRKEVDSWMSNCPIKKFEERELVPAEERLRIHKKVQKKVDRAVRFAKESPFPGPADLLIKESCET
jgi:TPP-dependent pyruvate/acetoin dehydrogenase alpha subunit